MDYPYYHGTLPQEFSGYGLDALSTPEQSHVPDTLSSVNKFLRHLGTERDTN